jgi:PAS domain S-box-containing protein
VNGSEQGLLAEAASAHRQALGESEERYRLLVESVKDYAIFMLDAEGRVLTWNEGAQRAKGYAAAEIIGRSIDRFYLPEDRALGKPAALLKTAADKERVEDEGWYLRKDGSRFWANVVITAVRDRERRLIGFSEVGRDLTERKAAEERYRLLVESAKDYAIFMLDAEGRVLTWNEGAQRAKGYAAVEIIGRSIECFYPPESRALGKPATLLKAAAENERVEDEGWRLRKDGSRFWANAVITAVRDREKRLIGFSEVSRDLSERKAAEEDRERSIKELASSNTELQQFAYVASHDLQEPLRMVTSYTQLLSKRYKGKLDAEADTFIAFAVDGAIRMQKLIQDLLTYSRLGTSALPFAPVDSGAIFARALVNLSVAVGETGATVTSEGLPAVLAVESQLLQLFQNLIGNAIKYHGDSPPLIHATARKTPSEWIFSLRDNGIGMDPQYADRIFVIFQRLHTADEYAGTGIGLAVCKKIVERHGGRIWVESTLGHGAVFYFTLPIKDPAARRPHQ